MARSKCLDMRQSIEGNLLITDNYHHRFSWSRSGGNQSRTGLDTKSLVSALVKDNIASWNLFRGAMRLCKNSVIKRCRKSARTFILNDRSVITGIMTSSVHKLIKISTTFAETSSSLESSTRTSAQAIQAGLSGQQHAGVKKKGNALYPEQQVNRLTFYTTPRAI